MKLVCPYCSSKLIQGFIDSGRYSFKWHSKEQNLIERYTVLGGEVLSYKSKITSYRCNNCNKIIIDLSSI